MDNKTKVLRVDSSGRYDDSSTRAGVNALVQTLSDRLGEVSVRQRDLAQGIPLVHEEWINANFTPAGQRNAGQRAALRESDQLVAELQAASVIVIGMPIYNFGVPASLKAWIDMVARAKLTFRYTDDGPVGLLRGKKAYVVTASGGVTIGSELDFATPYIRQALQFLGISDIEVIGAADALGQLAA